VASASIARAGFEAEPRQLVVSALVVSALVVSALEQRIKFASLESVQKKWEGFTMSLEDTRTTLERMSPLHG
jgi:5-bromo-4-chloroindolyl phosphate hydrolysis protein